MKKLIILICLLFVGCSDIVDTDNLVVTEIIGSQLKEGRCLYTVPAKPFDTIIMDKCGKYNINDKLILTKEIEK